MGSLGTAIVEFSANRARNAEHLVFAWSIASRFAIIRKGAESFRERLNNAKCISRHEKLKNS